MPRIPQYFIVLLAGATTLAARGANVRVEIEPRFNGAPLVFDTATNLIADGQATTVTRLDLLLSDFTFRRIDGTWIEDTNSFASVQAREGRTRLELPALPEGPYDCVRFHVGLASNVNHSDAAQYPAGHSLNPQVNGMHWGWMGGYVFLALEGHWLKPSGELGGFSYHLATDQELMTVELPVKINSAGTIRLALNVEQFLPRQIGEANDSTHSRPNDSLAISLAQSVEHSFSLISSEPMTVSEVPTTRSKMVMASNAVPYALTFSQFFPRPALPLDNPLTVSGVALGQRLFNDQQLSVNNTQSCASCHDSRRAFADGRAVSIGAEGGRGTRHAPALFNLAWKSSYFWDGRAATLRAQVLQPIQNPIEMHADLARVAAKLGADDYSEDFTAAFGSPEIDADRLARALEQYLLTLVSGNSKFDRVLNRADKFTAEEQRGFELFHAEYDPAHGQFGADCFHCHGGPLLQSQSFANNGLDRTFSDRGRYEVTQKTGDLGKFAVPSLRNVELTAPYMHDGRFATLEEVVEHYCTGVRRSATLDPNLAKHPDGGVPLSASDKQALVAFLKTLTDDRLRPGPQSVDSTTSPEARRSEQHSANTQNKVNKKGQL